ncbi:MFS transporter [Rubricoccus marinus]|uniref:MFS transporter n=1 Tax=Rubricoccus marinus TaxID=716817 RepID=A0A259U3V9_9BACT|nr:MFS transporter [Rubricoccus marinus]
MGYLALIRGNRNVRRLWGGTLVSLFGDWFNTLALYRLALELTGSELALGGVLLTKLLPLALAAPVAAALVDRLDRKHVMIGADLLRAVIVLGFLFVREPGDLWLLYTLAFCQIAVSAAFGPAKSAALPNITARGELLTANALLSASWSVMLALGAAAGGPAVDLFGTDAVFIFDAVTYLVSAAFIAGMTIPQERAEASGGSVLAQAWRQSADGIRYLRENARVLRPALAKATWTLGGGGLMLCLALIGDRLFPSAGTTGIGLLFAARGLGTGIGPILARALFRDTRRWFAVLGACIAISGAGYLAVGSLSWEPGTSALLLLATVVFAHAASGANWVLSTTILQMRTEDRFRGRVFTADWLILALVESASTLAASVALEMGVPLRTAVLAFASIQVAAGLTWLLVMVPAERDGSG